MLEVAYTRTYERIQTVLMNKMLGNRLVRQTRVHRRQWKESLLW